MQRTRTRQAEVRLILPGEGRARWPKSPLNLLHCSGPTLTGSNADTLLCRKIGTSERQRTALSEVFSMPHRQKMPLPHRVHEQGLREERQTRQTNYHMMSTRCSSEHTKKVFMELQERRQGGKTGRRGTGGTGANSTE